MFRLILVELLLLTLHYSVYAEEPQPVVGESMLQMFQGEWIVIKNYSIPKRIGVIMIFKDDSLTVIAQDGFRMGPMKFDLGEKEMRNQIDWTFESRQGVNVNVRGIYKLEQEQLLLCAATEPSPNFPERPTDFHSREGELLLLERQK